MPLGSENARAHLGTQGEELVVIWLKQHGYTILARNFRARCGEIDIVARRGDVVSFVEVKRRSAHYFNLSEVITPSKQRKISQTARVFIARHPNLLCSYRFDVAFIEKGTAIVYVEHAFCSEKVTW